MSGLDKNVMKTIRKPNIGINEIELQRMQDKRIIICIQGTNFQTTVKTLIKIPYIKTMLMNSYMAENRSFGQIFVDRPAHIFKHVLGVVTDDQYPYPSKYKHELIFYGIDCNNIKFTNQFGVVISHDT